MQQAPDPTQPTPQDAADTAAAAAHAQFQQASAFARSQDGRGDILLPTPTPDIQPEEQQPPQTCQDLHPLQTHGNQPDTVQTDLQAGGCPEGSAAEESEDPYAGMDPGERLQMEISLAKDAMKQFNTAPPTLEEIAQRELEEALILHQMSVMGDTYISQHSSLIPAPAAPEARVHLDASTSAHRGDQHNDQEETEVKIETEMQKFQARIKRTVAKDIQKMLLSNKAYVKHHSTPPTISQAQIRSLAKPKVELLHADSALQLEAGGDYTEYARRKTAQLQEVRLRTESEQSRLKAEQAVLLEQQKTWQAWRAERALIKSDILAQEAKQQQDHGRRVATYVSRRAAAELASYSQAQASRKVKAAVIHDQHQAFQGKVGERGGGI